MERPAATLGEIGEAVAARWAQRHGWRVLARRFRVGHRDIDLILRRDRTVAFVEVKTRSATWFGGPISAVGRTKRRHLSLAAIAWMDRYGEPGLEYRFDVIGVLMIEGQARVAHVENAFEAWMPSGSRMSWRARP